MKITSFRPLYGTKNVEETVKFFENFEFTRKHHIKNDYLDLCILENGAGMSVDVVCSPMVQKEGFFGIRMNVPDLQEAIDFFEENGGKQMTPILSRPSTEFVYIRTKNGDIYCVSHHIKKAK